MQREYSAVVENSRQLALTPQGTISEPLMGPGGSLQPAMTHYRMLHCNDAVALIKLTPKTGKRNSLRCTEHIMESMVIRGSHTTLKTADKSGTDDCSDPHPSRACLALHHICLRVTPCCSTQKGAKRSC